MWQSVTDRVKIEEKLEEFTSKIEDYVANREKLWEFLVQLSALCINLSQFWDCVHEFKSNRSIARIPEVLQFNFSIKKNFFIIFDPIFGDKIVIFYKITQLGTPLVCNNIGI